jgi:hypothetical protein
MTGKTINDESGLRLRPKQITGCTKKIRPWACRTVFSAGQCKIEMVGPLLEGEAAAHHAGVWD